VNRNEAGFGRLVVVDIADGAAREVSRGWHRGIDWHEDGIVCVRSGARTAPRITVLDPITGTRRPVARGAVAELDATDLAEPEPVTWTADDGGVVHGVLWRPAAPLALPETGNASRVPLLVDVHGGPTDQARVDWVPRVRFFVSRGWAVLAPNYRGSTGYGRTYLRALDHQWGIRDVGDTIAGIAAAGREGWADAERVAVMGGSAGGFTALLVAARAPAVVKAAVSLFGVTDLFGLAETTHRFESRYLDRLVGRLPEDADRYHERSPVIRAGEIGVPVLVLQGAEDRVVPLAQAQQMVDAMRAAGTTVEQHVYDGEGHGWSRAQTIADSYERIEAFLTRWVLTR
jgi:dipeptidyl aminopeptidase/acylaminoacyl peptidase